MALRRIAEAADRSYKVAPEPSRQRRMKLKVLDRLSLRMKSSAVVSEVFQGLACESLFLLSVVQQKDPDRT